VRLAAIDRNILNGLQFVAKILEIWFLFIAGTLVYNLSMLFARRQDGLPLQYLDLHEKLAGSVEFLRPPFWRAPLARQGGKRFSRKLYALLALTVALYATSTLLGPAIAILLLPVRERASIARLQSRQFLRLHSEHESGLVRPSENYSASYVGSQPATVIRRADIDQMTEEFVRNSGHLYPSARSSKVKIDIIPSNQGLVWVPSRRVLDQLFSQFLRYHASIRANPNWSEAEVQNGLHVLSREPSSEHNATYESILYDDGELLKQPLCERYKTSLGIGFRRQGPAIGFLSSCCSGNVSVISVTNDALVRCYTPSGAYDIPLSDPEEALETKCIRVGPGWPASRNHHAQVFLRGTEPPTDGATGGLSISVYSVSDATTRHCATPVANQPGSFCDWKALFAEPQAPKHRGFTGSQQLVKYGYESRPQSEDEPQSSPQPTVYSITRFSSDFHLAFGTYELDATQHLVNSTGFTALTVANDTSTTTEPLYIHPGWVFES
jgi:hypothetical protein